MSEAASPAAKVLGQRAAQRRCATEAKRTLVADDDDEDTDNASVATYDSLLGERRGESNEEAVESHPPPANVAPKKALLSGCTWLCYTYWEHC